jgi:hypothetical protein
MTPLSEDQVIRAMSRVWLKLSDVSLAIQHAHPDDKDVALVPSRLWKTLDILKKDGSAEVDYDPNPVCRLTTKGAERKEALLQPA